MGNLKDEAGFRIDEYLRDHKPFVRTGQAHVATYAPEGEGYRVTCPHGCALGLSSCQPDERGAQNRVELHRLTTEPLPIRQPPKPLTPDPVALDAARAQFTPGHPLSGSSTLDLA